MNNIARRLPNSQLNRKSALVNALTKKNSNPPSGNILTDATTEKLEDITPAFVTRMNNTSVAQAAMSNYTPVKKVAFDSCAQMCRNMINGINLAIDMGILTKGSRAYYGLEIETGNMLPMASENDLKETATQLVEGETLRIADGGAPLTIPTLAQITAARDNYVGKLSTYSNLVEALDDAQEAVNVKATEVDNFIKVLWAEIEARYAAEPMESKRANARLWGVVYVSTVNKVPVALHVVDRETGEPIANATGALIEADVEDTTNTDGDLVLRTPVEGTDTVTVIAEGYVQKLMPVDTSDDKPITLVVMLDRIAA